MTAPRRVLVIAVVLVAVATGIVVGTVFPALGVSNVYAVAASSAGAAVVLAIVSAFAVDSFDSDRYRSIGSRRQLLDAVLVAAGGFLGAAVVVFVVNLAGIGPLVASVDDAVFVSGRRILAAGIGAGAGVALFYARNRGFLGTRTT